MAMNPIPFAPPPKSAFNPPPTPPSLRQEMEANWQLSLTDQAFGRFNEWVQPVEDGFNPWNQISGYENYADLLVKARSSAELNLMKQRLDLNAQARDTLAKGEWGWMAGLLSGLGDPLSLVPIPGSSGIGFLKGAAKAAVGNAALTAASEPFRIALDPDAKWNEMAYSIGGAALFGAALGGLVGGISMPRVRFEAGERAMNGLPAELSALESQNIARSFDAREEGYAVTTGNTRLSEDGAYVPVKAETVEVIERRKTGSDGQQYFYDDQMGWTLEADRGIADPRAVAPEMLDELGVPERTTENRMIVDEAALKADYEQGKHLEARGGKEPLKPEDIRTAREYVTFKQIEAHIRRITPKADGETPVAYANRIQQEALSDLKARRASARVSRSGPGGFMSPLLDLANFSPVAKAVRLFVNDNVLGDLPLQLAGDYGWAIRANEFGYKTPPSLLLRAMRHTVSFNEVRQAIDSAWLRYVQKNPQATGKTFLGQNVTAAAEAMKARVSNAFGNKVLTKDQFTRMAGRAVFEKDSFKIDGFEVVPEAREAAKAWTRIAQRYDAEARELGIFYDQRNLERTYRDSESAVLNLKRAMASFLWGTQRAPSKLQPAIKIKDRMYFGDTHEDAIAAAMDDLGPDIEITPDAYGYVDNLVTSNDPKPELAPERIKAAAIKIGENIYEGTSHFDAVMVAAEKMGVTEDELLNVTEWQIIDGFTTSTGRFVDRAEADVIAKDTGQTDPENDMGGLLSENMTGQAKVKMADELKQASKPAHVQPKFRSLDDVVQGRIDSLSESQRTLYDDFRQDLENATVRRDNAKAQLDQMKAEPHRFKNQFGEPEPYFARYWNHTAIQDKRAAFKRLLTKWYERDNPNGAAERAEQTIDGMLKLDADDEQPAQVPGLRHLMKRKLDMPNSWKINDAELGEIAAADFFNTDLEVVTEAYTRGMGHKIEAARMFGDADLWAKRQEIRQHFRDQYLIPAEQKGQDLKPLLAQRNEYLGWIDIIKRSVLGGLKTKDPWNFSGRTARNLKNFQVLTSMGRVLLTSIPEAMRIPMVNGFATTQRGIWLRAFSDWDKIKANVEFSRQSGELFDLVRDVHAARVAELNQPDPSGGGRWIEKKLESLVPGFLKLVGQTHWTVMAKDLTMFTAQHKVMDMALKVNEGNNAFKLGSIGISKTDAKLLASMPYEMHGSIILPAVNKWAGADGRRARTLLLDAIHAEARRAIVTPSLADKSLLFQGVMARRGKVVWENDLMTLPLQFMSYSLSASQKILLSGLQGRDQNLYMGAFTMFLLGVGSNYLKQPQTATMNKSLEEWLIEGYESSGVGAFWFSDLNQMIERYSYNTIGLRPLFGADPRFGKTTGVGDLVDAAGPSIGTLADVISAFNDPEKSMTNKAQAIRRAVPYNNVLWWGWITRDIATVTGKSLQ